MKSMDDKAQTAPEYLLAIAAAVAFAALVIVLFSSNVLRPGGEAIGNYSKPINSVIANVSNAAK